tara:strand:+ start:239 stop:418 length:180 start_codon:yes stop_codon:yes gene_type:complete
MLLLEHQVVVRVGMVIMLVHLLLDRLIQECQMQMFPLHHFLHLPHGLVILVDKDHQGQV